MNQLWGQGKVASNSSVPTGPVLFTQICNVSSVNYLPLSLSNSFERGMLKERETGKDKKIGRVQ